MPGDRRPPLNRHYDLALLLGQAVILLINIQQDIVVAREHQLAVFVPAIPAKAQAIATDGQHG